MAKKRRKKNKHKCPSCPKEFQSMKQLDGHCINYHGGTYEELMKAKEHKVMTLGDFIEGDSDE